jgi:Na+/H+ antiporter NhaD/arsenite permease-like protein
MVVVGGLPVDAALAAIKLDVLILLFGVLVIAAYLQEARFFRLVTYLVLTRARSARSLLFGLTFVAGALSALILNDTVCVVLTPLVVAVVVEARLPALPYLLALAAAANVGGVVSFSGNPQNMIIGEAAHGMIGFAQYLALALPVGVACLTGTAAVLVWLFRHELPAGALAERSPPRPAIDRMPDECRARSSAGVGAEVDRKLAGKGLLALAAFAGLAVAGVSLTGASMVAAAGLMVVARTPPKKVFASVDWQLLVFFAGLFVVVAGIERAGMIDRLFGMLSPVVARGDVAGDAVFVALAVFASNLVSNVPLVLVAVPWVPHMPDPTWGYVMLAVASTLAGNLTLFGSVANIIVMESAGRRGEIGFWKFLRYGAVVTSIDLALAFAILGTERAIGVMGWLGL